MRMSQRNGVSLNGIGRRDCLDSPHFRYSAKRGRRSDESETAAVLHMYKLSCTRFSRASPQLRSGLIFEATCDDEAYQVSPRSTAYPFQSRGAAASPQWMTRKALQIRAAYFPKQYSRTLNILVIWTQLDVSSCCAGNAEFAIG